MTDFERIQFAQAALACKRLGLLSHTTPANSSPTGERSKCVTGRIRHHYKDGIACQYCGAPKGSRIGHGPSPLNERNRLHGFDLS